MGIACLILEEQQYPFSEEADGDEPDDKGAG